MRPRRFTNTLWEAVVVRRFAPRILSSLLTLVILNPLAHPYPSPSLNNTGRAPRPLQQHHRKRILHRTTGSDRYVLLFRCCLCCLLFPPSEFPLTFLPPSLLNSQQAAPSPPT